jgi:VanZ family protein
LYSHLVKGTSFFSILLGILFGVWLLTLWILSSMPGQSIELPPFLWSDKAAHLACFFVGGSLLAWLLHRTLPWRKWGIIGFVVCAMALIGALDEFHQLHTEGRTAGTSDWVADCAGGALGAFVIGWIYARAREGRREAPSGVAVQAD